MTWLNWLLSWFASWFGLTQAQADSSVVLAREVEAANNAPETKAGVVKDLQEGKF